MRAAVVLLFSLVLCAQDVLYPPEGSQLPGPPTPAAWADWLADIRHWRDEKRIRIGFDGKQYDRPELAWSQRDFIQPQMMVEERYFYDPVSGKYTVDRYLDDLEKRYGGIDSVLIWPVYPNVGIDNRSQYDLTRDMPGGIEGLRGMIADFHRRGVRVFFPVMPWEQGTRDEGVPLWVATARLMAQIGADGVNGDTFNGMPRVFRDASDAIGHPLVFEPEVYEGDEERLAWNQQTWGYWEYPFVPRISKFKWLETRHMVNVCRRWGRDKTDDLQYAYFNGVGFESWENIWGIWNQITPRDAEALRRVARIERQFADLLVTAEWEPHTPTQHYGAFASKFSHNGRTLWTVVNRNEYNLTGRQIEVPNAAGVRYFDIWNGVELHPELRDGRAVLSFATEPHGFGGILATREPDATLEKFLDGMHQLARTPLSAYSHEWTFLPQQMVDIEPTQPATSAPPGMVRIPAAQFEFRVSGIEIEGENDIGVDVQYPWEDSPRRHHLKTLDVKAFYMDRYPVTNAEFGKFLEATHYHPRDDHTRAGILRGGSYYQPQGSHWYFPQAYKLDEHGKYLLMSPGKDRSGTVGFRCVVDAG